jgi:hypothetical protein
MHNAIMKGAVTMEMQPQISIFSFLPLILAALFGYFFIAQ